MLHTWPEPNPSQAPQGPVRSGLHTGERAQHRVLCPRTLVLHHVLGWRGSRAAQAHLSAETLLTCEQVGERGLGPPPWLANSEAIAPSSWMRGPAGGTWEGQVGQVAEEPVPGWVERT